MNGGRVPIDLLHAVVLVAAITSFTVLVVAEHSSDAIYLMGIALAWITGGKVVEARVKNETLKDVVNGKASTLNGG